MEDDEDVDLDVLVLEAIALAEEQDEQEEEEEDAVQQIGPPGGRTANLTEEEREEWVKRVIKSMKRVNTAGVARISHAINVVHLKKVTLGRFCKKSFPAVEIKILEPAVTCFVFSTGTIDIVGAKSAEEVHRGFCLMAMILSEKLDTDIQIRRFRIHNRVATLNYGVKLDLARIKLRPYNSGVAFYNPATFPGLHLKVHKPRFTAAVFASGKVVMAGVEDEESFHKVLHIVMDRISGCAVGENPLEE